MRAWSTGHEVPYKDPECWYGRSWTHDLPRCHARCPTNWATGRGTKRGVRKILIREKMTLSIINSNANKIQTLRLPINPKRRISCKLVLTGRSAWEVGQARIWNSFLLSSFLHSQLFLPLLFPLLYLTWLKRRKTHTGTFTPRSSYKYYQRQPNHNKGLCSRHIWLSSGAYQSASATHQRWWTESWFWPNWPWFPRTNSSAMSSSLPVRQNRSVTGGFNRSRQPVNFAAYFLYQMSFESLLSLLNQYSVLNLRPEYRKWHFRASGRAYPLRGKGLRAPGPGCSKAD